MDNKKNNNYFNLLCIITVLLILGFFIYGFYTKGDLDKNLPESLQYGKGMERKKEIEIELDKEWEKLETGKNNNQENEMITTESGLQYEVLVEGTGSKPGATDTVEVHYEGTLEDGTVFDSSYKRGKKISFPLNGVIKGWTEGLQLMSIGSKYKFTIPADLAYGDNPPSADIPIGAILIFDIELFDIK